MKNSLIFIESSTFHTKSIVRFNYTHLEPAVEDLVITAVNPTIPSIVVIYSLQYL